MGRKLALSIGIGSAPMFRPLPGAMRGAAAFKVWAEGQNFEVVPIDDTSDRVVADEIKDVITKAVGVGDVERLFIYFAGHGVARGQGEDCRLLSDAMSNADAVIDVARSLRMAHTCGIRHIAIFADTCRTAPQGKLKDIRGQTLFPSTEQGPGPGAKIDRFYATRSGDATWEFSPVGEDPRLAAYGIFTRCLMSALAGEQPEALTEVKDGVERFAVQADPLASHLEEVVPEAARMAVGETQTPDAVPVTSWKPDVLAWVHAPRPSFEGASRPRDAAEPGDGGSDTGEQPDIGSRVPGDKAHIEQGEQAVFSADVGDLREAITLNARSQARLLITPDVRASTGDKPIARLLAPLGRSGYMAESSWITSERDAVGPALIELEERFEGAPMWVLTAVIPGYRSALRVGRRGVASVAYISSQTITSDDPGIVGRATALFAGGWLSALSSGPVVDRALEELNPTLAILAAYALDRVGQHGCVRELLERFVGAGVHIPFDVALVARMARLTDDDQVVPGFPLMTRGWAFLDEVPSLAKFAERMQPLPAPAPWATGLDLPEDIVATLLGLGVDRGPIGTPPGASSTPYGLLQVRRKRETEVRYDLPADVEQDVRRDIEPMGGATA